MNITERAVSQSALNKARKTNATTRTYSEWIATFKKKLDAAKKFEHSADDFPKNWIRLEKNPVAINDNRNEFTVRVLEGNKPLVLATVEDEDGITQLKAIPSTDIKSARKDLDALYKAVIDKSNPFRTQIFAQLASAKVPYINDMEVTA